MNELKNKALKAPPLGITRFETVLSGGYYYVDKTPFIKKVLFDDKSQALLITRPRRFGKTLSMASFFNFVKINPENPDDCAYQEKLFAGTKILEEKECCNELMGKYPVIFLSFKDVSGDSYAMTCGMLAAEIASCAQKHEYLLKSPRLSQNDKDAYAVISNKQLLNKASDLSDLGRSLRTLTDLLYKHYGRQVIVLIDEYDVPLAHSFTKGYYPEMVDLTRVVLSSVLKDNDYLKKAVITGCLRISRESIFTGLNNVVVNTVANDVGDLAECMGFTKDETLAMLNYYDLSEQATAVKEWYDGYRIGDREIFCTWDVINFCTQALSERNNGKEVSAPQSFWINSSSNEIIYEFMQHLDEQEASRMQTLLDGGEIDFELAENFNYNDITLYHRADDFWTLLLFTGYLTKVKAAVVGNKLICTVRIPNKEVRSAFEDSIFAFYRKDQVAISSSDEIVDAILQGNANEVSRLIALKLKKYVSVRDSATRAPQENFYHGFLNGIFSANNKSLNSFHSNAEAGDGYADIVFSNASNSIGVVIEVKACSDGKNLSKLSKDALAQIDAKEYCEVFDQGLKKIYCYGIAFCHKKCYVQCDVREL